MASGRGRSSIPVSVRRLSPLLVRAALLEELSRWPMLRKPRSEVAVTSLGKRKAIQLGSGFLVLAGGFFCLNYTKAFGVEHHFEWAAEHGMPEPSYSIFVAGVLLVAGGGVWLGRASRSGRS